MRKLLLGQILILMTVSLYSQVDTIYFDYFHEVSTKNNAEYFKVFDLNSDKKYPLSWQDISRNNDNSGQFVEIVSDFKGKEYIKYRKHKSSKIIEFYLNNKLIRSYTIRKRGTWIDKKYYNKEGNLIAVGTLKNGKKYEGEFPSEMCIYYKKYYFAFVFYENGELTYYTNHYKNGKIAVKYKYSDENFIFAIFYNTDGKEIGKCTYKNNAPYNGKNLVFLYHYFTNIRHSICEPLKGIRYIDTYNDSKIVKRVSLDYYGNEIGTCTYKNNSPYNGTVINEGYNRIDSYKDGIEEGLITVYDKKLKKKRYSYSKKKGKLDGEMIFYYPSGDKKAIGYFKDGKPFQGKVYSDHSNTIYSYNNGVLEGECLFLGSKYYNIGELKGFFKNGKEYNGRFISGFSSNEIHEYKDGNLTKRIKYFPGKYLIRKKIEIFDGTDEYQVMYYDDKENLLCHGIYKNHKPYDGTFVIGNKIISYRKGLLHGEYKVYDREYDLISSGEYRDGKPYNGQFSDKNKNIVTYKDGFIEDKRFVEKNNLTGIINYKHGKKYGRAIFYSTQQRTIRDYKKIFSKLKIDTLNKYHSFTKDSCIFYGYYKDDKFQDGILIDNNLIASYKNGNRDGKYYYEISGFLSGMDIKITENYKNGLLDGESVYVFGKKTLKTVYLNGKILNGFKIDSEYIIEKFKSHYFKQYTAVYYENGVEVPNKTFKYVQDSEALIYVDNTPYEGYRTKKNFFFDIYKNGLLSISYYHNGLDTIKKTIYRDNIAITRNKDKEIFAKTVYTKKYSSGTTDFYTGNKTFSIEFRDNFVYKGYLEYNPGELYIENGYVSKITLFSDSKKIKINVYYKNSIIREEIILDVKDKLKWKGYLGSYIVYNAKSKKSHVTNYYNTVDNTLITSMRYDSDMLDDGCEVQQRGNTFEIIRYDHGLYIDTYKFTDKELKNVKIKCKEEVKEED